MVRMAMNAHVYTPDGEAIKPSCKQVAAWIGEYADDEKLKDRSDTGRQWHTEIRAAAAPAGITALSTRTVERALGDTFFSTKVRLPHYDFEARDVEGREGSGVMERLVPYRRGKAHWFKMVPSPLARVMKDRVEAAE